MKLIDCRNDASRLGNFSLVCMTALFTYIVMMLNMDQGIWMGAKHSRGLPFALLTMDHVAISFPTVQAPHFRCWLHLACAYRGQYEAPPRFLPPSDSWITCATSDPMEDLRSLSSTDCSLSQRQLLILKWHPTSRFTDFSRKLWKIILFLPSKNILMSFFLSLFSFLYYCFDDHLRHENAFYRNSTS